MRRGAIDALCFLVSFLFITKEDSLIITFVWTGDEMIAASEMADKMTWSVNWLDFE